MESAAIVQSRSIIAAASLRRQDRDSFPENNRACCSGLLPSGIESALFQSECEAVDRQHIRSDSVMDGVNFRVTHHFLKAACNDVLQPIVDFAFPPKLSLA